MLGHWLNWVEKNFALISNSSVLLYALLTIAALLALIATFMFGQAVWQTLAAVIRLALETIASAFRFLGSSLLALGWYMVGVVLIAAIGGGWLAYVYWFKPGEFNLAKYRPPVCTELIDRNGHSIDYICPFDGVRLWKSLDGISTNLRVIVVMLEDDKFYEHGGLDIDEIWNALEVDLERKKLARGGSTITQQLAKNLFLSKEKSVLRKVSEVPLAMRLERELTKDQILELYLNSIEWGPGIFGIEAASRLYFDHDASTLSDEEAWLLALMIPNPKELNLWVAPKAKKSMLKRAQHLSTRLYTEHRLSKGEASLALARFKDFIEKWETRRPETFLAGRRFPARWGHNKNFSLSEVVSIRRGASGILRRYRQAPLQSRLDSDIQRQLEEKFSGMTNGVHVHDLSDVIVLMDGKSIRAMVPIQKPEAFEQVKAFAESHGMRAQVFQTRNIPAEALWE